MEAVEVRKALDGGYWVTCRTDSLAEAMRGVDVLLAIPNEAFDVVRDAVYVAPGTLSRYPTDAPPLDPATAALVERLDASEEPTTGLRAGQADDPARSYEDGRE